MQTMVTRWALVVSSLVPESLVPIILAIIENESGGYAGIDAYTTTKYPKYIPKKTGGSVLVDRAYGLMQVIPMVYEDWNKKNEDKVYWEDISGTSEAAGIKQIKVGLWTFLNNVQAIENITGKSLYIGDMLNWNVLNLALISYAWGIGRVRTKMEDLINNNLAPTFDNIKITWPDLGLPKNRPLVYADKIIERANKYVGQIWDTFTDETEKKIDGFTIGGIGAAVALGIIFLILKGKN